MTSEVGSVEPAASAGHRIKVETGCALMGGVPLRTVRVMYQLTLGETWLG